MRNFIAVQQFKPREQEGEERCIWCKQEAPRNRAHIISRKLTLTSHSGTVLKYSVCKSCNARCGEIEGWVLRNSPLGWLRFFYYLSSNRDADTDAIPAYFYAGDQQEWLIYKLEGRRFTRTIDSQLILTSEGQLRLIAETDPYEEMQRILDGIRSKRFAVDVRSTLPHDFSPRALVDNDAVIVIARTEDELQEFVRAVQTSELRQETVSRLRPLSSGRVRQHFRWSSENWLKFCAKVAYETLCLFEGSKRCLEPEFDRVRSYVLAGVSKDYRELVFDKHGPLSERDIPTPLRVDLSTGQNCSSYLSALLLKAEPGMHSVALYQIDGWVCSSISISGFPPSFLVLGGPDAHLSDLYILVYDEETDEFDFVRLAYDPSKPVIPLPVSGGMSDAITRTYRLHPGRF